MALKLPISPLNSLPPPASRDSIALSEGMRPKKYEATWEGHLFQARLDQIVNMKHELLQLAGKVDWAWIDEEMAPLYGDKAAPGSKAAS